MNVLVATPYRVGTDVRLLERAAQLYAQLTFPQKTRALYPNSYGYSVDYATNAQARNDLLAQCLPEEVTHVLWVDVDLVDYPADLIERLTETADVAAPLVMLDKANRYYDIGAFIQDGQRASMWPPYFDTARELDSVGTCYLIPAEVYRPHMDARGYWQPAGARYQADDWRTEHWNVMQAARAMGLAIRCNPAVTAWHAYLPDYGMRWQTDLGVEEKPKVRILIRESCAGLWGAAGANEVVNLDANVAESLIRGGLAVLVDETGAPLAEETKKKANKRSSPASAS
ncbi:MAG: hypothetical protein WCF84_02270 [Anaerolineae bacterium]